MDYSQKLNSFLRIFIYIELALNYEEDICY